MLDRRDFIRSIAAGGALMLEINFNKGAVAAESDGVFQPNAWLAIDRQGTIKFILDKAEMGQGVHTALAMILAEELEVDPAALTIEMAPVDSVYGNPAVLGLQITGGSTSVSSAYLPLRRAGAMARTMLIEAAARRWQVPAADCHAEFGRVHHLASGKSVAFAELAPVAAALPLPESVMLKDPNTFKLIGKPRLRLDSAAKIRGQTTYGIDVRVDDLCCAVLVRGPTLGATVKDFAPGKAPATPGFIGIYQVNAGIAVVARHYYQAQKAAALVDIHWSTPPGPGLDSDAILAEYKKAAIAARDDRLDSPDADVKVVKAEYTLPYLAHAAMEPSNCTARIANGLCEVWAPTQSPSLAQQAASEASGLGLDQVKIHSTFLGGGFGRRLKQDFVFDVVQIAKACGKPVKLIASRQDDIRHDHYRPATAHALAYVLGEDALPVSVTHCIAGPSILAQNLPAWIGSSLPPIAPNWLKGAIGGIVGSVMPPLGLDQTSTEGAKDNGYDFGAHDVSYLTSDPGVPVGFWRSVGHSHTAFVVESSVDDMAHAAGIDPAMYRRLLLTKHPRHLEVLDLVLKAADYTSKLPKGWYRGLAMHESFGSICAQVVEIEKLASGACKVRRVVCASHSGRVINPKGADAQLTGAIIFALSAAIYGHITIRGGQVEQSNFHDYPVLRLPEVPRIETHLVASDAPPSGLGEPGVPPLAPALANALFAATGIRQRQLPLQLG